jgi:hypothetical protein
MKKWPLILVPCVAVMGCAELKVKPWGDGLVEGIPYSLPLKAFSLTVEYELKDCYAGNTKIQIDRKVGLNSALAIDPDERYYVPYSSLRNWFKAIDLTIDSHDNQTLKGASAAIEDKTGTVLTSLVSTAISLSGVRLAQTPVEAAAPVGAPGPLGAPGPKPKPTPPPPPVGI